MTVTVEKMEQQTDSIQDIVRLTFDLSKKQTECFMKIKDMETNGTCILNLVSDLESERSIVQKQLKVLLKKGLITRKSVTLAEFKERCIANLRDDLMPSTNKGYLYMYSALSDVELIGKMQAKYSKWINTVKSSIYPKLSP